MTEVEKMASLFTARVREIGEAKAQDFAEEWVGRIHERDLKIIRQCWLSGFIDGAKSGWIEGIDAVQKLGKESDQ